MKVIRKFNNNVLMSKNDKGEEVVLIGNGLAFSVKIGDTIDNERIEKTFVLKNSNYSAESIESLLNSIPEDQLEISKKIITLVESELKMKLNDFIYLTLSDHLQYAYQRVEKGTVQKNPLINELKLIYPKEFELALKSLELIEQKSGIKLPIEEAGFITLHIVNAQQGESTINETIRIPKMIKEIIRIIEFHFSIELDTSTLTYSRFLTHLKLFVNRSLSDDSLEVEVGGNKQTKIMLSSFETTFPKVIDCVNKIIDYMEKSQSIKIKDEEKFYLFVYLHKLTKQ